VIVFVRWIVFWPMIMYISMGSMPSEHPTGANRPNQLVG